VAAAADHMQGGKCAMRLQLRKRTKPRPDYRTGTDISPEAEQILRALEQGKRSQLNPMSWPEPKRQRQT
jgi:hypothetical protein